MVTKLKNIKNIWKTVIGLEIHAQINTKTKLFSIAPYKFNSPPNSNVAFFDIAMPGTLPILNGKCIELAILAAKALKAELNHCSEFDRKHYFYSDMPAGYQITQNRYPIARNGKLCFHWKSVPGSTPRDDIQQSEISIRQMHIEQDSGKSFHDYDRSMSMIDLNRAGVGLLEVVTDCQFRSALEAVGFVRELRDLFSELGICSGHMEKGELRVDANVSVMLHDSVTLGERTEIKNINSLRGVWKAIEFESKRQIDLLESNQSVINETRFYDSLNETTVSMRDKEHVQDYRYFPEPNLPTLILQKSCNRKPSKLSVDICSSPTCVPCIERRMEGYIYPHEKREILINKFCMSFDESNTILAELEMYNYILSTSEFVPNLPDRSDFQPSSWLKQLGSLSISSLLCVMRQRNLSFSKCPISTEKFSQLVTMVHNSQITYSKAIEVINHWIDFPDKTLQSIVQDRHLEQINDRKVIEEIIKEFLRNHPQAVADYKAGNKRVARFIQKNIISQSNGLINFKILNNILYQILNDLA